MKSKNRPLIESPRYSNFIQSRDHALEEVLTKYLRQFSGIINTLQRRAEEIASLMGTGSHGREHAKRNREQFQQRLTPWFEMGAAQAVALIKSMCRTVYVLSAGGQAEAIGRAMDAKTKVNLSKTEVEKTLHQESPSGGALHARIELVFHRLLRDVVDAFHLSQVQESPIDETLDRIGRAFPKSKRVQKVKAPMAKLKEAAKEKPTKTIGLEFNYFDEDEWGNAVDDYLSDEIPFGRAPYDKVFAQEIAPSGASGEVEIYQWELEQEVTEDFVRNVRNGENDAARENGITDFLYIAIIDAKTDDCCAWRDGLTLTEIEDQLKDHGDDCDGKIAPPLHFNCRCRVAPMTDDLPEVPPPDFGGFNDWLESRAEA